MQWQLLVIWIELKTHLNNRYLLKQFKTKCYGGNFMIGEGETRGFFQFPIVTFVVNIPRKIEQ